MSPADTPSTSDPKAGPVPAPVIPAPISFGPYRLDPANARLLNADRPVALTPKAFDVLHLLASRPDRLVSKEELLSIVWPDVLVSDASVKVCVREIRKALQDDADAPRYIETVHRRGYRFIGRVEPDDTQLSPASSASLIASTTPVVSIVPPRLSPFIGRSVEVHILRDRFNRAAASGVRECLFVAGRPGSGKTALIEAFVRSLETNPSTLPQRPRLLIGHCFEQFGIGEPYMPIWEALARLAREQPGSGIASLLDRHAAAQLAPAAPFDRFRSSPSASGTAAVASEPRGMSERLLREMTDAIESLATDAPLVLVLEDVHWADYSTLDLICALARRRHASARLLVVCTYRPDEIREADHPLRDVVQNLLTASLARELPLRFLSDSAVSEYLAARFTGHSFPESLARRLHQRTDGHPLFLVHLVDDLVEQGVIDRQADGGWRVTTGEGDAGWQAVLESQVPQTVRAMIELQVERLKPNERHVLEAAAVAGVEFSAAAVAAALDGTGAAGDVVAAEQVCEDLARRQRFLESRGVADWPDGTAATHYRFVHELNHNVVYERIPVARKSRMHRALGMRIESAWGDRATEEAAALAAHFEAGRDWPSAVRHLRRAANAAGRQYAHREAVRYLRRALAVIDRLPAGERGEDELPVLMSLGVSLQVTDGFAAPEYSACYARALALCETDSGGRGGRGVHETFAVLWGIWMFNKVRSDLRQADAIARRLLALALEANDPALLIQAHQAMCLTHLCLGQLEPAVRHMDYVASHYDPAVVAKSAEIYGQDPGVATLSFGAVALWLMGRTAESMKAHHRAAELAEQLGRPSTLALSNYFAAMLHQLRGDLAATIEAADEAIRLSTIDGFTFWHAGGTILRGWATAMSGLAEAGLTEMRRGIEQWTETGSRTYTTYHLGLLAEVLLRHDRADEASRVLGDALTSAHEMPEGIYEPELHRLKGCALAESTDAAARAEAGKSFDRAIEVAVQCGATWTTARAKADIEVRKRP